MSGLINKKLSRNKNGKHARKGVGDYFEDTIF
jgi:hypothetical protein